METKQGGHNSRSMEQLIHEDTERPVICGVVVTFVQDDLRGHVLRRAAERPRLLPDPDLLGEAEVNLVKILQREAARSDLGKVFQETN